MVTGILLMEQVEAHEAIANTGAENGVIGKPRLPDLSKLLALFGLQFRWKSQPMTKEALGIGGSAKVLGILEVPMGFGGTEALIDLLVSDQDLPLLLPNNLFVSARANICYDKFCVSWPLSGTRSPIRLLPSKHPVISFVEFPDAGRKPSDDISNSFEFTLGGTPEVPKTKYFATWLGSEDLVAIGDMVRVFLQTRRDTLFSYTPEPSNCDSRSIFMSGHIPERDERPIEFDVMLQPAYHISRRFTIRRDDPEDWSPFVSLSGEEVESSNRAAVPCGNTVSGDAFFRRGVWIGSNEYVGCLYERARIACR